MAKKTSKSEVMIASSQKALSFIQTLQKEFAGKRKSKTEKERLRQYLARFEAEELRSVARRVMIDLVKPPVRTIANAGTAGKTGGPVAKVIPLDTKKRRARTIAYAGMSALGPPPSQPRQGGKTAARTGGTAPRAIRRLGGKHATSTGKSAVSRSRRKSAKS